MSFSDFSLCYLSPFILFFSCWKRKIVSPEFNFTGSTKEWCSCLLLWFWSYSLLSRGCCEVSTVFVALKWGPSNNCDVAVKLPGQVVQAQLFAACVHWAVGETGGACPPSACTGYERIEWCKHDLFFLGSEQGLCKGESHPQARHQQMWQKQLCQHHIQELQWARQVNSALCSRAGGMQRWLLWFCV